MNPLTKGLSIGCLLLLIAAGTFFGLWRYEIVLHDATRVELKKANDTIAQDKKNNDAAEKANHEYQTDIDRLTSDVKRLRNRPAKCVTLAKPAGIHADQQSGAGHGEKDGGGATAGIRSDWLIDYAIEAEGIRIERNACVNFVNQIWEAQQQ